MGCLKLFEEAERIPWQVHKKGESSSKAYVYAYNNPVNFSDPAGLTPRKDNVPIPTADIYEYESSGNGGGSLTGWNGFINRLMNRNSGFAGNGTFARGGVYGSNDFMSNPYTAGSSLYAEEEMAQQEMEDYKQQQKQEALANLGLHFVDGQLVGGEYVDVLTASSNENQMGVDGIAYAPLYNVETVFVPDGSGDMFDYLPGGDRFWQTDMGQDIQSFLAPIRDFKQGGIVQHKDPDGLPSTDAGVEGENVSGMSGFRLKYPGGAPLNVYERAKALVDSRDAFSAAWDFFFGDKPIKDHGWGLEINRGDSTIIRDYRDNSTKVIKADTVYYHYE